MTRMCAGPMPDGSQVPCPAGIDLTGERANRKRCGMCRAAVVSRFRLRHSRRKAGWPESRLDDPPRPMNKTPRDGTRAEQVYAYLVKRPLAPWPEISRALDIPKSVRASHVFCRWGMSIQQVREEVLEGYWQRIPDDAA